jgi:uncharacterized protein with HEPN domain
MKYLRDYLLDILEYLDSVAAFTSDGRAAFMGDRKTQFAVIHAYEVIREIAKRLPPEAREANPQINWQKLITFRDFLAHNYDRVVLDNIWAAVEDLPNLRSAIESLLSDLPQEPSE